MRGTSPSELKQEDKKRLCSRKRKSKYKSKSKYMYTYTCIYTCGCTYVWTGEIINESQEKTGQNGKHYLIPVFLVLSSNYNFLYN